MIKNSTIIKFIAISLTLGLFQNSSIKAADCSQSFVNKEVLLLNYSKRNKLKEIKELLKPKNNSVNQININAKDDFDGYTSLQYAISYENLELIQLLLKQPKIDVNVKDAVDCSLLHNAISANNIEILKLLLAHPKVDVNVKDDNGDTALHRIIFSKNIEIIKLLLGHPKIDVYIQNNQNRTVLEEAKFWENDRLIKLVENHIWSKSNCSIQ